MTQLIDLCVYTFAQKNNNWLHLLYRNDESLLKIVSHN